MGQAGEAILFLLPSELAYLELLQTQGCKVKELAPNEATKDIPNLNMKPVRLFIGLEHVAAFGSIFLHFGHRVG